MPSSFLHALIPVKVLAKSQPLQIELQANVRLRGGQYRHDRPDSMLLLLKILHHFHDYLTSTLCS